MRTLLVQNPDMVTIVHSQQHHGPGFMRLTGRGVVLPLVGVDHVMVELYVLLDDAQRHHLQHVRLRPLQLVELQVNPEHVLPDGVRAGLQTPTHDVPVDGRGRRVNSGSHLRLVLGHGGWGHLAAVHTDSPDSPPLRVCGAAGDGLEERQLVEGAVEEVDQAHAEGSEQVERLAHKMTTCGENKDL